MKAHPKVKLAVLSLLFLAVLLLAMLFMPFEETAAFNADDYHYGMAYSKQLPHIPVLSQETGYTCYAVSMAIVKTYLGAETTEQDLRSELALSERTGGMLPNAYLDYAGKAFQPLNCSVALVNPTSETEILNAISASLELSLPAVIFYSAKDDWNEPHYNTHYAVVYGIDMKNEVVSISNPYGYLEQLSFAELFDGLDFVSYKAEPLLFRLGRRFGVIKKNSIILFEKVR